MPRKRKLIDKHVYKLEQGKCRLCGDSDPAVLDVHRIQAGADGGTYTRFNCVTLCCKCHRKVHDNQIQILKYYLSSNGSYLLHVIDNGEEKFI